VTLPRLNDYFQNQIAVWEAGPKNKGALAFPKVQRIELPVPPSSNVYWRCWRGRMVKSAEARAYAKLVWVEARRQKAKPVKAPAEVGLTIHWTRKARRGDLDNRLKVIIDALKGLAWSDDKLIASIHAERSEGSCDGVVVTWWRLGEGQCDE
jgi:Holliday junction resolvase RusA-like endonuclease